MMCGAGDLCFNIIFQNLFLKEKFIQWFIGHPHVLCKFDFDILDFGEMGYRSVQKIYRYS